MKKQEALNFIRQVKGFIPYITLFEIYNDNDEIPIELIELECKKEDYPRNNFMICNAQLAEQLKDIKF